MRKSIQIGNFKIDNIYCGDSLNLMKDIQKNCIDLIITDPPFAIDFKAKRNNYNRTAENVLEGYSEVPKEKYKEFTINWIKECHRILKENGSMYVFSGWNNLKDILIAIDEIGFITINHLIWKYQFGVFTKNKFVTSHYHILFVVKDEDNYTFNKIEHYPEDVIVINREYWTNEIKTPTKLPTELVRKLILYSSNEEDLVFDPFLGSGTVAVVSKMLNRHYLGFEIVEDYYKFAKERLEKTQVSLEKIISQIELATQ